MFNSGRKKEAMEELERIVKKYKQEHESSIKCMEKLYLSKKSAVDSIKFVEVLVNSIANKPKEFEKEISKIIINIREFDNEINSIKKEFEGTNQRGVTTAVFGVTAGTAVATLGSTAAMAVATTFGTASTGTAIASLSGAAATNAALAWLGGGALTVGGSGMVGGSALIALSGPIGWSIAGVSALGSGIYMNSKNKQAAEELEEKCYQVRKEKKKIEKLKLEISKLRDVIFQADKTVLAISRKAEYLKDGDYSKLNTDEKFMLMTLVNESKALTLLIVKKIKMEN